MRRQQKWNLKDGVAELNGPSFGLKIDASTPALGGKVVFSKTADKSNPDAALFQVRSSVDEANGDSKKAVAETVETYCRGRDLISRYVADSEDPIAREIYWRLVEESDELSDQVFSVETIYSLQTDLLDSAPQPSVPSVFSNASNRWFLAHDAGTDDEISWSECSWEDACFASGEGGGRVACLIGFSEGDTLLQTVYPSDLRGVEINVTGQQTEIHWGLRSDFLEKGVIRRLRLLTVMGGDDSTEKDLLDAASQFYRSELPLTV